MTEFKFDFDLSKKIANGAVAMGAIMTREYRPVRMLASDAHGDFPLVGLITIGRQEVVCQWTENGKCDTRDNVTTNNDLILLVEDEDAKRLNLQ